METFRAQLYALTMVEPARQKLMLKGKLLKVRARAAATSAGPRGRSP